MGIEPTAELVAAGKASGYGAHEWVALAASALREARAGMRGGAALSADEAIALVGGVHTVGELFPQVVSDVAVGFLPSVRDLQCRNGFDTAQMITASSALYGAAAGFSRGGGWLDYAHTAMSGFRPAGSPPLPASAFSVDHGGSYLAKSGL